jgi:hypothetical protein
MVEPRNDLGGFDGFHGRLGGFGLFGQSSLNLFGAFLGQRLPPLVFFPGRFDRRPVHAAVVGKAGVLRRHDRALQVWADLVVVHPLVRPAPRFVAAQAGAGDAPGLRAHEGGAVGVHHHHERHPQHKEDLQRHASQQQPQHPASKRFHGGAVLLARELGFQRLVAGETKA